MYIYFIDIIDFMRDVADVNYKFNLLLSQCIPRRYLVEMEVIVIKKK